MRKWLAVGVVFGVLGAVSAGCSSASAPSTVSSFCDAKAQAECGYVQPVCQGLSLTACVTYRTSVCQTDAQNAVQSGDRSFNSNNVGACIAVINSTYSVLHFGTDDELAYSNINGGVNDTSSVDFICESVFQGNAQPNARCTSNFDCVNGNICTPASGGATVNVCATPNQVQDGMSCSAAGDYCVSGDVCPSKPNGNGEYLCEQGGATLGGQGAKCTSDADCDSQFPFCDTYTKSGCQLGYTFGASKDCNAFGATN